MFIYRLYLGEGRTYGVCSPKRVRITLRKTNVGELSFLEKGHKASHLLFDGKLGVDARWLVKVNLFERAEGALDFVDALPQILESEKKGSYVSEHNIRKYSRAVGDGLLLNDTSLYRQECLIDILRILLVKASEHLEVCGAQVWPVKFPWRLVSSKPRRRHKEGANSPAFKKAFAPGGRASTPALIDSKHCSSGIGLELALKRSGSVKRLQRVVLDSRTS